MLDVMSHTRPQILMSPFCLTSMARPLDAVEVDATTREGVVKSLVGESKGFQINFTLSGRGAIDSALNLLGLDADAEVLIATTTQSSYISSCVTSSIEKICNWSRKPSANTRAIFCIHEFGFPAKHPEEFRNLNVPIISDCAYALGVDRASHYSYFPADFYIFSFSKSFAMPSGGAVVSRMTYPTEDYVDAEVARHLLINAHNHLSRIPIYVEERKKIWDLYREFFLERGLAPHSIQSDAEGAIPHAFVVAHENQNHLNSVRKYLNSINIESSIFFGNGGYFLPCHHNMSENAVSYVVKEFLQGMHK